MEKLTKPAYLPKRARFIPGPAVHLLFDGGAQRGKGTAGFVILNNLGDEVMRVGMNMGEGYTNNEAEIWGLLSGMR